MWARLKRLLRAAVRVLVEVGEDPERVLKQNLREMEELLPEINGNLAFVRSTVDLLEEEVAGLEDRERHLSATLAAALREDRRELATAFAATLEVVREDLASSRAQLETARRARERALRIKRRSLNSLQERCRQTAGALSARRRREWLARVRRAVEELKGAGVDAALEEEVARLGARSAPGPAPEAGSVPEVDLEQEARRLQESDLLRSFEQRRS